MIPPSTWGCYARRSYELAQRRGHQVYDQRAFETATALDGMRRFTDLAEFWIKLFVGLTPERLAEALVDGEAPRYLPVRQPVDSMYQ